MKDYRQWMAVKSEINSITDRSGYSEGDVVWVCIGENVGFEEDGKGKLFARPVLIVRGFSRELFWGVPLTTLKRTGIFYYSFQIKGKTSTAILSQLKVIDTARISGNRISHIKRKTLLSVREKLSDLLR